MLRRELLVFVPWVQVMTRFERELYRDPDQDLGAIWWELVERYQRVDAAGRATRPDDWACKIHVALAPVYYHNYLLGEVTASQLAYALARETGARARRSSPPPPGVPARALHAPGRVAALGRADRAGDGRAALRRPPRELARDRRRPRCCS